MGESYRGLTIKIGGDVSGLSKALKSADNAIRQTQSELRKIDKGLKFDSTSTMLINSKIDELGQRSQQANARLVRMKETLNSLKGTQIEKLAQESKNLALAAENARTRYARVDEELARTYRSLEKVAKANDVAFDRNDIEGSIAALKEQNLITDEQIAKIRELRKAHNEAFDSNEIHKQALQYKDLTIEIQRTEAEVKSYVKAQSALKSSSWDKQRSDVKALKEELDNINGISKILKNEFKTLESAFKLDPSNISKINDVTKNLSDQIGLAEDKANSLKKAISNLESSGISSANKSTKQLAEAAQLAETRYEKATQSVTDLAAELQKARENAIALESASGKGSDEYKEQQNQVKALEQELKKLIEVQEQASHSLDMARGEQELNSLKTQLKATNAEMGELQGQMSGLTAKSSVANSAIKLIGMTAYATVSPAFMQLGYSSINAADQIDSSFRNMKKTVNGTEEDFNHLRDAAIEFSRTNAVSADTILNIEAMGGQLGIAVENLEDFGEVVSNLDIATNMDADTIAEKLGQLNGIMPDINDNYEAFGDALVRLGNNMPAQESAIMDVTSRIGSMGSIVGMTTPEILAWATAIASTGQGSESAGTAISNTMSDIETAVSSGGDKLQAFADVAGMSAQEFADAWNNTPSEAMQAFVEGLKRINEEGGSVDGTLQGLGITGVRQKQALQGLTQTCDTLNDSLTMSEDAWNGVGDEWGEAGDAAREAAQKSEGFSGALQILKNSANELGYEFGQAMIPFIEAATAAIQIFTDAFKAAPGPIRELAVVIGLLGVASGPAITGYSSLANAVGQHKKNAAAAAAAQKAMNASTEAAGVAAAVAGTNFDTSSKKAKLLAFQTKAASVAMKAFKIAAGGIAVAALAILGDQLIKAYEHSQNLTKATTGLEDAVSSINTTQAQGDLSELAGVSGSTALSVEELTQKSAELADTISERNQEVVNNSAMLEEYGSVIDELAYKEGLTKDEAARLKAAVDGLNDSCGTNYEVVQNSAGAYEILKDGAEQSKEAILELIDAQELQWKSEAVQSNYEDTYKQKLDAINTVSEAQKKYDDELRKYNEWVEKNGESEESLAAYTLQTGDAFGKAGQDLKDAKANLESLSDSTSVAENQLNLLTMASMDGASANAKFAASNDQLMASLSAASGSSTEFITACDDLGISLEDLATSNPEALSQLASSWDGNISSMIKKADELGLDIGDTQELVSKYVGQINETLTGMGSGFTNKLQSLGIDIDQFSQKLFDAGISTEQLNSIGSENIAALATAFQGNVDQIVWAIENYNNAPIIDKNGNVAVDETQLIDSQNNVYTWNGTQLLDKDNKVVADDVDLLDAQGHVVTWNGTKLEPKEATAEVSGDASDGRAESQVEDTSDAISGLKSKDVTVNAKGNYGSAASSIWDLGRAIGSLVSNTVKVVTRRNAKGGIRMHADGGIATRAVPLDIVGEAGAEAIVPLTNKRYSQPFVNLISDGVVSKLSKSISIPSTRELAEMAADSVSEANRLSSQVTQITNNTTTNSSQTIVYQIGDITLEEGSDAAKLLENFVDLVIDSKGAM